MEQIVRINDDRIDELEVAMLECGEPVDCPLRHIFTPHLYVREIFMAAETLVTSKVHKTCHPYVILQGVVSVKIDSGEWETYHAPHTGITMAGTRRVLYIHEDTVWCTFHALEFIKGDENLLPEEEIMKVVDVVEDLILEPYENNLLQGILTNNKITKTIQS